MRRWLGWPAGAAASGALFLALTPAAEAQPVGLFTGSAITVSGWTFTVSNCSSDLSVVSPTCGSNGAGDFADVTPLAGAGSVIEVQKNGGGTLVSTALFTGLLTRTSTVPHGAGSRVTVTSAKTNVNERQSSTVRVDTSFAGLTNTTGTYSKNPPGATAASMTFLSPFTQEKFSNPGTSLTDAPSFGLQPMRWR